MVLNDIEGIKTPPATAAGEGLLAASGKRKCRAHESKLDYLCDEASEEYYALVHTAIPDRKVCEIPGATAALDKEWEKLFNIEGLDLASVANKSEIIARYKKTGKRCISARCGHCVMKNTVSCLCTSEYTKDVWCSEET